MNQLLQSSETKNSVEYAEVNTALKETQERALRVTEALYRTTDLFSDNEPLKWSLRESAVKILQAISALDKNASFDDFRETQRAEKNIRGLLVHIELAASSAFMARKNFEVLEREYIILRDMVAKTAIPDACSLSPASSPTATQLIGQTSAPIPIPAFNSPQHQQNQQVAAKKPQMSEIARPMSERQDKILRFIQKNGISGVGDIACSLGAGISGRTVQRDLNALVGSGLLKKEGEKRWRRYFL